jgi:hypothetical protein
MPPSGRFFIEEDLNAHYAVDVLESRQGLRRTNDVWPQDKILQTPSARFVVPAVLLSDQKVVRAGEP